jgi:hypothetical protein
LATLATVSAFLAGDVLPVVPKELTGEVRAAVKLLETAARELDERYHSVTTEIRDLLDRCADIAGALGLDDSASACARLRQEAGSSDGTLTGLEAVRRKARSLTSALIVALHQAEFGDGITATQRDAHRALLFRTYACLARHPRSRLSWQSVFSTTPARTPEPTP